MASLAVLDDDELPEHLRSSIQAVLSGRRNIRKTPPPRPKCAVSLIGVPYAGGGDAASEAAALSALDAADSIEAAAPGSPGAYSAARSVGAAWFKEQQREWNKQQAGTYAGSVADESAALLVRMVGPTGLDPARWRRLTRKVDMVAERNIRRKVALERQRKELEEWDLQQMLTGAAEVVRQSMAECRSSTASSPAASSRYGGGGGSERGGGGCTASSVKSRYMEADTARSRILKELKQLAAKHAAAGAERDAAYDDTSPSSPYGTASASAVRYGRSEPGGSAEGGGVGSPPDSPGGGGGPAAGLQYNGGSSPALGELASKMASYLEVQGAGAARVARAATGALLLAASRSSSPSKSRGGGGMSKVLQALSAGSMVERSQSQVADGMARWAGEGRKHAGERSGGNVAMTEEQVAAGQRLVQLYEDACSRHGLHADPRVSDALAASMRPPSNTNTATVSTSAGQASAPAPHGGGGAAAAGVWSLHLHGHTLELEALTLVSAHSAEALAEVLRACTHITTLRLARCVLSAPALGVLLPAAWSLRLRALALDNTDLPPPSWATLQRALGRPTVWGVEAYWWNVLRSLALCGNALADRGLCALQEVLPHMPLLEALALRQTGLTDLSAPQLTSVLCNCRALTDLDVGYNNLGPAGAAALAAGLPYATRLARLGLAWNSVGGGVHHIGWAVVRLGARHCALRHLDLSGTDLVAEDLISLAAVLYGVPHTPITHLVLSCNNIVGVAGQVLLRHVHRLMPETPPLERTARGAGGSSCGPDGGADDASYSAYDDDIWGASPITPVARTRTTAWPSDASAAASAYVIGRTDSISFSNGVPRPGGGGGGRPLTGALKGARSMAAGSAAAAAASVRKLTIRAEPTPLQAGARSVVSPGRPATASTVRQSGGAAGEPPASTVSFFSPGRPRSAVRPPQGGSSAVRQPGGDAAAGDGASASAGNLAAVAPYGVQVITIDCRVSPGLLQPHLRGSPAHSAGGADATAIDHHNDRHQQGDGGSGGAGAGGGTSGDPSAGAPAASPSSYHTFSLDLSREHPDRATGRLLMEHEVAMRRHGHRTSLHALKWRGKVYRRDGQQVAPLDVVYEGWTHSLPYEGTVEAVVAVLPPALCPWLTNKRLHFNATQMLASGVAKEQQQAQQQQS